MHTKHNPTAEIFHIDCDPLKERMLFAAYPALIRAQADCAIALEQLIDYFEANPSLLSASDVSARRSALEATKKSTDASLKALEAPAEGDILTAPLIVSSLRNNSNPAKTLVCNEAISNYPHVWNHFSPTTPGTLLSSGASSLGWALGAAIGAKLAGDVFAEHTKDLIAVVVGDGSFVFGVPSASYWMARRYETPFLTIVLNNGVSTQSSFFPTSLTNALPHFTGLEIPSSLNARRSPQRPRLQVLGRRFERLVRTNR